MKVFERVSFPFFSSTRLNETTWSFLLLSVLTLSFLSGCSSGGGGEVLLAPNTSTTATQSSSQSPLSRPERRAVTSYGAVTGIGMDDAGTVFGFLGVPYAKPPVGSLRWLPPQPPANWQGDRPPRYITACVQGGSPTGSFVFNEDCLYLNIYMPNTPGPHPVMVWIHGGGFLIGAGNESEYDGTTLARDKNVVVVNVNYRLSFTGYLALSQLTAENGAGYSGNQGFYDQVAALKWVKQEIGNFGGDPNNVTLFGESAGAISTCVLLASPLTDGLFQRAIMQSGNCHKLIPVVTQAQAEQTGATFLGKIGCATDAQPLTCARNKSTQDILKALNIPDKEMFRLPPESWAFSPTIVIDGKLLPQAPLTLLAAGAKQNVPVILGTNKDEGTLFTELRDHVAGEAGYLAELQSLYGATAATAISALYPYASYSSTGDVMAALTGDLSMNCPARTLADVLSDTGHAVYMYHFIQPVNGLTYLLMTASRGANTSDIGVFHASEIPYVFGATSIMGALDTVERMQTASHMTTYWTTFARNGDPNAWFHPNWPRYTKAQPGYIELGGSFASKSALRQTYCQYWNAK